MERWRGAGAWIRNGAWIDCTQRSLHLSEGGAGQRDRGMWRTEDRTGVEYRVERWRWRWRCQAERKAEACRRFSGVRTGGRGWRESTFRQHARLYAAGTWAAHRKGAISWPQETRRPAPQKQQHHYARLDTHPGPGTSRGRRGRGKAPAVGIESCCCFTSTTSTTAPATRTVPTHKGSSCQAIQWESGSIHGESERKRECVRDVACLFDFKVMELRV